MQPFPRWVTWIFVLLLAYILYTGNKSQHPPESTPEEPTEITTGEPRDYDSLRRLTDGNRWYRAIDPNFVGEARIKELKAGEGAPVACGNEVEVLLRGTNESGASYDEAHDDTKPLTFRVGAAPIAALDEGVIGMKEGGTRQLVASSKLVYGEKSERAVEDITFHLTLKTREAIASDMPAYAVTTRRGDADSEPARCGETIKAKFSVYGASGKRIYASDVPVAFTLGKQELASGIDQLARGLYIDEERLLTLPPQYLKQSAKADGTPGALRNALTGKELVVVQITRAAE